MKSSRAYRRILPAVLVATTGCLFAAALFAQSQTTKTTTTRGATTRTMEVERGEVVNVYGNDLIVRMASGEIRHFPNIPESARVTVDGKELGIHDLKPGMKLQRTITTTSTPLYVTTVKTITGKVWQVVSNDTIVLTVEGGENQMFTIPKGEKFTVNGKEVDAFGLKRGMRITATEIVEVPVTAEMQHSEVTGSMPPAPPAPPAGQPILILPTTAAPAAGKPAPAPESTPR
jgi:hypothetical protein